MEKKILQDGTWLFLYIRIVTIIFIIKYNTKYILTHTHDLSQASVLSTTDLSYQQRGV